MLEREQEALADGQRDHRESIEPQQNDGPGNGQERPRNVEFAAFDLGFRVMGVPDPEQDHARLMVIDVVSGSDADRMGLEEGDRILKVNDHKVEGLQSLKHFIAQNSGAAENISFEVQAQDGTIKTIQSK
jgi:S1-C subfamily serine protease